MCTLITRGSGSLEYFKVWLPNGGYLAYSPPESGGVAAQRPGRSVQSSRRSALLLSSRSAPIHKERYAIFQNVASRL